MNVEELKNNTEYADAYDGMDIEMTYAEKPEFRLLFDIGDYMIIVEKKNKL
ncbi:MAG: hypothetical protein J6P89_03675 [Oscillospiraceae bacterium]|nr:hypothetical protein [Oscillospiraceae bacterium]